jgi:hypothetical protein
MITCVGSTPTTSTNKNKDMAYLIVKGEEELSFYEQEIELAKAHNSQKHDSILIVGSPKNKRSENIYALGFKSRYTVLLNKNVHRNLSETEAINIMHSYINVNTMSDR